MPDVFGQERMPGAAGIGGYWFQIKLSISSTQIHVSKRRLPKHLVEFDFTHKTRAPGDWIKSRQPDK